MAIYKTAIGLEVVMTNLFSLIAIGALGPYQILIILVLVVLLFGGRGKISAIMGDMGKGITSFKKGLKDEVEEAKDVAEEAIDVTPKEKSKSKK